MKKVQHPTEFVLIKASSTSQWDPCTFAILHLGPAWKQAMRDRMTMLSSFAGDISFYCLTYWDHNVEFFASTGGEVVEDQQGVDLLEEDEIWSYVETTEQEISRFKRPENRIRTVQIKITQDPYFSFHAWGEHTGEEFSTEQLLVEDLLQ